MKSRFDSAMRLLSAAVPAVCAAASAESVPSASHDDAVIRTVGAGFSGFFGAVDLLVAAPAMLLPFGTRALRAALMSATVTGLCGAVAFEIAHAIVLLAVPAALARVRIAGRGAKVPPRLLSAVAAVGTLTALLSPAWQIEGSTPGGAVTAALVLLLALRGGIALAEAPSTQVAPGKAAKSASEPAPAKVSAGKDASAKVSAGKDASAKVSAGTGPSKTAVAGLFDAHASSATLLGLVLGLAATYGPFVFLSAVAALAPAGVVRFRELRAEGVRIATAFGVGLLPFALMAATLRRPAELSIRVLPTLTAASASDVLFNELGTVILGAGVLGFVLLAIGLWPRSSAISLVLVAAGGVVATALAMPAGPTRYSAPLLAAFFAVSVAAAIALGIVVIAIARAPVPFAEASAALVVVLELVLPVRALDDATTRLHARAPRASSIWSEIAWGPLPPASLVLLSEPNTMRRAVAARAIGEMRPDLVFVPTYDLRGPHGTRALVREPKLAPLYRDVALGTVPEELSLAQAAGERPVITAFDPKWDRALARHLVPLALSSRFETEPRGVSDRKKALDAFVPSKDRLVRIAIAKKDPDLARATATLLRARAIGMAATGEREMLSRALDDLRAFSPQDPIGAALVRRMVTNKGVIDVRDLAP